MKKIISLILICCMVMPMICASAADEPEAQPTIEEILNSYHEKAFAAQTAGDAGASTWSSRSGKTLEEETVDELTAAGYEAYNVTSENYEALEEALQTDFADMGLDPEGSYIIVISGEDPAAPGNNSRANGDFGSLPEEDYFDDGSGNGFQYTYGETTYTLRFVTVTSATEQRYFATDTKALISAASDSEEISEILNSVVYIGIDALDPTGISSTIMSILGIELFHINLNYQTSLSIKASASWTRVYTQVYAPEVVGGWYNGSSVDFVKITKRFLGDYYKVGVGEQEIDETIVTYRYSENYYDYNLRASLALRGLNNNSYYHEYVGDVSIYLCDAEWDLNSPTPDPVFYFYQYEGYFP